MMRSYFYLRSKVSIIFSLVALASLIGELIFFVGIGPVSRNWRGRCATTDLHVYLSDKWSNGKR